MYILSTLFIILFFEMKLEFFCLLLLCPNRDLLIPDPNWSLDLSHLSILLIYRPPLVQHHLPNHRLKQLKNQHCAQPPRVNLLLTIAKHRADLLNRKDNRIIDLHQTQTLRAVYQRKLYKIENKMV